MYTNLNKYAPVGTLVYSDYWHKHYRVVSHNTDGTVTVHWEGDDAPTTHRTPFVKGRDHIVQEATKADKADKIARIAAAIRPTGPVDSTD